MGKAAALVFFFSVLFPTNLIPQNPHQRQALGKMQLVLGGGRGPP